MALDFAEWPEAMRRTLEIAERCNVEIELGKILLPRFPCRRPRRAFDYLRELCEKGLQKRYGDPPPPRSPSASLRARRRSRDGLRRLLPDRLGLRQVRQGERDRRRPGPRLGGRLDRRLLPRITDIDPLRYDLLFERFLNPGPQVDARHRHRLLGARPRAVINYVPRSTAAIASPRSSPSARWRARRGARRRRACSGALRRRRPIAKLIPEQGRRRRFDECLKPGQRAAQGRPTTPIPTRRRSSTSPSRSRASCATTRSTPPAS
jgi:DNA polymerase-3 subunit alpha